MLVAGSTAGIDDERVAGEVVARTRSGWRPRAVVELVAHAGAQLVDQALGVETLEGERGDQAVQRLGVVEVGVDRVADARVLHLHGHLAAVAGDRAVHLPDARGRDGIGLPVEEDAFGRLPELVGDHLGGELRRHRRRIGLQGRQRLLGVLGQRLDDEAEQLAELHHRALHVAELAGDVLRRADARTAGRARRAVRRG